MTDELCQRSAQVGQSSTTCDAADEKKHWRAARRVSDIEMAIVICTYVTIKMWDSACNNMYTWTFNRVWHVLQKIYDRKMAFLWFLHK